MKNYYDEYYERFLSASEDVRKASKEHWKKCHDENMASGRLDMIIFSAQILAAIDLAERQLAK